MKSKILIAAIAILMGCKASKTIEVEPVINLGKVKSSDTLYFNYPIRNISASAIPIRNIQPSCGCVHISNKAFSIAAHSDTTIKAYYVADANDIGEKSEIISLRADDDSVFHNTIIKATIESH